MSVAKKIKMMLVYRDMTLTELSNRMGKNLSTVSDKMKRDNFSERDLKEIAELLDFEYDIIFTDKETGKTI